MHRSGHRTLFVLLILVVGAGVADAKVFKAPLEYTKTAIPALFPESGERIEAVVVDRREDKAVIGGGLLGAGTDEGKGLIVIYVSETDEEVGALMQKAADDALRVLGFEKGAGARLEIALDELWVDMYRFSNFAPMNCIGYGDLEAVLRSADGDEVVRRSFRLTFFDRTVPVGSMLEVSREALSRILAYAAWQVTAETLRDHHGLEPDATALEAALGRIEKSDEVPSREILLWVGLAGKVTPEVQDSLMNLAKNSKEQLVRQGAAEALAMLGVAEAAGGLRSILSGTKSGGWENDDLEQVWFLIHALALLGADDLATAIPTEELKPRSKLDDLVRFHETGEFPAFTEEEQARLDKERSKMHKKRKG